MKLLFCKSISCFLLCSLFQLFVYQPVYGFSIGEERIVGEKLLYTVRRTFPLLDDPDLIQYLDNLGEEVLSVAGLQYFNYHFFIIRDDEFNAFAAPSGLVFFYSGLINAMRSENELVSVLAHEIGHVAKRHIAGKVEKGKIIGAASIAVALAALALGGGAASQALLTGSLAAGQSANLHFSRKDEEEADLMAYEWMKQLNRNPVDQKNMLETMRRVSRYRSERLPQYLLTHPNPEARLHYVQSLLVMDESALAAMPDLDNFRFLRFKYRILAETSEDPSTREYLGAVLGDVRATELEKTMAKYGLAQLERKTNNFDKSRVLLEEVISQLPEKKILQTDLGVLLYSSGDYLAARVALEHAYRERPGDMYAAFYLGKSYQALGESTQAKAIYSTVSSIMPEYAKVFFELGKISSQQQQHGLASLYLGKYHLLEGKLKSARFSLKRALEDASLPSAQQSECEALLKKIERLESK